MNNLILPCLLLYNNKGMALQKLITTSHQLYPSKSLSHHTIHYFHFVKKPNLNPETPYGQHLTPPHQIFDWAI